MVPTQQARQGVTGHNMRYVLGISMAAVIVFCGALRHLLRKSIDQGGGKRVNLRK